MSGEGCMWSPWFHWNMFVCHKNYYLVVSEGGVESMCFKIIGIHSFVHCTLIFSERFVISSLASLLVIAEPLMRQMIDITVHVAHQNVWWVPRGHVTLAWDHVTWGGLPNHSYQPDHHIKDGQGLCQGLNYARFRAYFHSHSFSISYC